jgi:hypothetical protein
MDQHHDDDFDVEDFETAQLTMFDPSDSDSASDVPALPEPPAERPALINGLW